MPTATFNGNSDFSGEIQVGPASTMVFPSGRPVPVTDEVAQVLVKRPGKEFTVVDADGKPVKPAPAPKPATTEPTPAASGEAVEAAATDAAGK
ncbi:MAG: hypothetical protein ACOY3Z_00885 [Thermodesulfobacteriota bacterium]